MATSARPPAGRCEPAMRRHRSSSDGVRPKPSVKTIEGKGPMAAEPLGDFYIRDDGASLRRTGSWIVTIGGFVFGGGLMALMFAMATWSGYEPQAMIACVAGAATIWGGLSILHESARRRPRLIAVPVGHPVARHVEPIDEWPRQRIHVDTWTEPYRALPAGRDRN
jgi:hypothetical protein